MRKSSFRNITCSHHDIDDCEVTKGHSESISKLKVRQHNDQKKKDKHTIHHTKNQSKNRVLTHAPLEIVHLVLPNKITYYFINHIEILVLL